MGREWARETQVCAKRQGEKGFTLIELMATLAILALVIGIAVPAVGSLLTKADASADSASVTMVEFAAELAHVNGLAFDDNKGDAGAYTIPVLIDGGFLALPPENPLHSMPNYAVEQPDGTFVLETREVRSENPASDFIVRDMTPTTLEILEYIGTATDVVIPKRIEGKTVVKLAGTSDDYQSFFSMGLTSVSIPDTVTEIGAHAFDYNDLMTVTIPNSVVTIGNDAFASNYLATVKLSEKLETIEREAFRDNNLTTLVVPASVKVIAYGAFSQNQLRTVELTEGITSIGEVAFASNFLLSVDIPDSVSLLEKWAFTDNWIESVELPVGITAIYEGTFHDNELESILIPDTVTTIGKDAFSENQLTSVTIPAAVTKADVQSFYYNDITSVTVLNSAMTFGINGDRNVFHEAGAALTIYGHEPSSAKDHAALKNYTFKRLP